MNKFRSGLDISSMNCTLIDYFICVLCLGFVWLIISNLLSRIDKNNDIFLSS